MSSYNAFVRDQLPQVRLQHACHRLKPKPAYRKRTLKLSGAAYGPIPTVEPGDTVWWHADMIHGVEDAHQGKGYSNVIYIGAAPDCEKNRVFSDLQRAAFETGASSPDFAAEDYELGLSARATPADLTPLGRRQMGYAD